MTANAATDWDVTGDYDIRFVYGGNWDHDLALVQNSSGSISGVGGGYPANGVHTYTWVVDSGSVVGNDITFAAYYTATADAVTPLTEMTVTGTIAADGSMNGTWHDNYQGGDRNGTWYTISGKAKFDPDHDGVFGDEDVCPNSFTDDWVKGSTWGTNRWQVVNGVWTQNQPVKKGKGTTAVEDPSKDTKGCTARDLLAFLVPTYGEFGGHVKFGLSSSMLQELIADVADGKLDGLYWIEKVTVPSNDTDGVLSSVLMTGAKYVFKASGTANAGDNIEFDADYSFRTGSSSEWTDAVSTYESYGDELLDLQVNSTSVDWGAYNASNMYSYEMMGAGLPASFQVYDVYYPNNTGSLTVDIYAKLW